MLSYAEVFKEATGLIPYPYQEELAQSEDWPELLDIPTGLGKTAAVVMAWIWRRRFAAGQPPVACRLVYCLPVRTLVEQTLECVRRWLSNLDLLDEARSSGVLVHQLMGGEVARGWQDHPECECVLVGTTDMLMSRALNRGYALSRYAWPVDFGLLNNDCLWVLDETQLMGVAVETSAQLQGFRGPH